MLCNFIRSYLVYGSAKGRLPSVAEFTTATEASDNQLRNFQKQKREKNLEESNARATAVALCCNSWTLAQRYHTTTLVKASRFHCGHIFISLVHGVQLGFDLGNDDLIAPWIFVAWY